MKTFIFQIENGGSAYRRYFGATAANQSEAAQAVCKAIGGDYFITNLIKSFEHEKNDPELRTYRNLLMID